MLREQLAQRIRRVSETNFTELALEVFAYQARHNSIYAQFLELLRVDPDKVRRLTDIPALPIACFKEHRLRSGSWPVEREFTSSGTSGTTSSRHLLRDPEWYRFHARRAFELRYGPLTDYAVLALLPAYLERRGSSLVFMVADFMQASGHPANDFYLHDRSTLIDRIRTLSRNGQRFLLLGVSFALLDLAEDLQSTPIRLPPGSIIMETGGMKGRRREMTRAELHADITAGFLTPPSAIPPVIHSEYGMTELLSQAYAPNEGRFRPAPTLRVFSRDLGDPLHYRTDSRTGALNCIDLANLDTISFIATDDLGRVYPDGSFEVLGRMDHSDTRGCNLLYAS